MDEQSNTPGPIAKAELYDQGNDIYRLVAFVRLGGVKIEIDKEIDTRTPEQKARSGRTLKTVK